MSHEGIRFVSEETARKSNALEQELPRDAITPERVHVNKTEGTGVEIDWKDAHRSHWTFGFLRDACPCATCIEEREASGREPGQPKPQPRSALPMYKAPVRPKEVRPVGRYAMAFDWNDGHTSGIYSWRYLRQICQCNACKAENC
jgi:DUF971 family protein